MPASIHNDLREIVPSESNLSIELWPLNHPALSCPEHLTTSTNMSAHPTTMEASKYCAITSRVEPGNLSCHISPVEQVVACQTRAHPEVLTPIDGPVADHQRSTGAMPSPICPGPASPFECRTLKVITSTTRACRASASRATAADQALDCSQLLMAVLKLILGKVQRAKTPQEYVCGSICQY